MTSSNGSALRSKWLWLSFLGVALPLLDLVLLAIRQYEFGSELGYGTALFMIGYIKILLTAAALISMGVLFSGAIKKNLNLVLRCIWLFFLLALAMGVVMLSLIFLLATNEEPTRVSELYLTQAVVFFVVYIQFSVILFLCYKPMAERELGESRGSDEEAHNANGAEEQA